MTKRHCGTILVRYSAEATAGAPPRPVARSGRQGRGAAADRAARRPRPRRAPTPRRHRPRPWPAASCSFPTSLCPTTSSVTTCPATVRVVSSRREQRPNRQELCGLASGGARPLLSCRRGLVRRTSRTTVWRPCPQRRISRGREHSLVRGTWSRLPRSCHCGDVPRGGLVRGRPPSPPASCRGRRPPATSLPPRAPRPPSQRHAP